eukprot:gene5073-5314_t
MQFVSGEFLWSLIAFSMKGLQVLHIQAYFEEADKLVSIFKGPWLPELTQLVLYTNLHPLDDEWDVPHLLLNREMCAPDFLDAMVSTIQDARRGLHVSWHAFEMVGRGVS